MGRLDTAQAQRREIERLTRLNQVELERIAALTRAKLERHTACIAPKSARRPLRSAGRGKRMIFAQMAGLLAMPTLLPEGVLSAEGEDAQAVNSS